MKNILIAVTGLSPQIVSETLFVLSVKIKIKIDELFIVTTKTGKEFILGKGKNKLPSLKSEIAKMCREYKINCPTFDEKKNIYIAKEESLEISDVKTNKDNQLFPNLITNVIREKSSNPENVLYCSLSGGRKTMSAYMGFALSLFARENDMLYHVIVNDEFEKSKKFYPDKKDKKSEFILSEVPYLKLRSIIGENTKNKIFKEMSYSDLVKYAQTQLKIKSADKLYLNPRRKEVWFKENEIQHLQPKQIEFYRYLAELKNPDGCEHIADLAQKFYNDAKDTTNILGLINKINKVICSAINDFEIDGIFKITGPDVWEMSKYGILAEKDKIIFIDR